MTIFLIVLYKKIVQMAEEIKNQIELLDQEIISLNEKADTIDSKKRVLTKKLEILSSMIPNMSFVEMIDLMTSKSEYTEFSFYGKYSQIQKSGFADLNFLVIRAKTQRIIFSRGYTIDECHPPIIHWGSPHLMIVGEDGSSDFEDISQDISQIKIPEKHEHSFKLKNLHRVRKIHLDFTYGDRTFEQAILKADFY